MDFTARASLHCPPERVFEEVADLSGYPEWLGMVQQAEPAPPHPDDAGPAWAVELGARLGPITPTKRVRMVRTEWTAPAHARFERAEHDGREHNPWVLAADVEPDGQGSRLTMHLHYGGGFNLPFVEQLLKEEVARAGERLEARLQA